MAFIRANQAHELPMAMQQRPDTGHFAQAALAAPPRHRHGEQSTFEYCLLDLADDFEVVLRPFQMKGCGEVRFAEEAEIAPSSFLAIGIDDFGQRADVSAS